MGDFSIDGSLSRLYPNPAHFSSLMPLLDIWVFFSYIIWVGPTILLELQMWNFFARRLKSTYRVHPNEIPQTIFFIHFYMYMYIYICVSDQSCLYIFKILCSFVSCLVGVIICLCLFPTILWGKILNFWLLISVGDEFFKFRERFWHFGTNNHTRSSLGNSPAVSILILL